MLTQETKAIISMADTADNKKRQVEGALKQLQKKRDNDKIRLLRDELIIAKMKGDSEVAKNMHLRKTINEAKQIMDEDHELSELRKKRADIEKKVSEINHLTGQSEYEDEFKRREAVERAKSILQAIRI
jgi:hypothetical protein